MREMATYYNPSDKDISFEIGTRPGAPPDVYACKARGTCEGPAAYERPFKREGLVLADTVKIEAPPALVTAPVSAPEAKVDAVAAPEPQQTFGAMSDGKRRRATVAGEIPPKT